MKKIIFFILIFLLFFSFGFSKWNRDGKKEIIQSYEFIFHQMEYLTSQGLEKHLCDEQKLSEFVASFRKKYDPELLEDFTDRTETKGILMVEEIADFYNTVLEDDETSYDFLEQIRDLIVLNPILIRQLPQEIADYFGEKGIEFVRIPDRIVKTKGFFYIDPYQNRQHFNTDVYFYIPSKYISTTPVDISAFSDIEFEYSESTDTFFKATALEFLEKLNDRFELPVPYIDSPDTENVVYLSNSALKKTSIQENVKGFRFINGNRKNNENEGLTEKEYTQFNLRDNLCYTDGAVLTEQPEPGLNEGVFFTLDDGASILRGEISKFTLIISASSFKPLPYKIDGKFNEIVYKPGRKSKQKIYESYKALYDAIVKLVNRGLENEMGEFLQLNSFKESFVVEYDIHRLGDSIDDMESKGINMIKSIVEFYDKLEDKELAYDEFLEDIKVTLKIYPLLIRQPSEKMTEEFKKIGISFERFVSDRAVFITDRPVDIFGFFDSAFKKIGVRSVDQEKLDEFAKFIDAYPVSQDDSGILFTELFFEYLNEVFSLPSPYKLEYYNGMFYFRYLNAIKQVQKDSSSVEGLRLFDFSNLEGFSGKEISEMGITDEGLYFFKDGELMLSNLFRHYLWLFINGKTDYIAKEERPVGRIAVNAISFEPCEFYAGVFFE